MQREWRHIENGRSEDFVIQGPVEKAERSHRIILHHLTLNDPVTCMEPGTNP
jgi:hypothetical protein